MFENKHQNNGFKVDNNDDMQNDFDLIWVLRPVKTISLILSQVSRKVGRKQEIQEKKHLTTLKQKLTCLTLWPELSSNTKPLGC